MSEFTHAFDPELSMLFTQQCNDRIDCNIEDQTLFYALNQSANDQAVLPNAYHIVTQALKHAEQVHIGLMMNDYSIKNLASLQYLTIDALSEPWLTQKNQRECIEQTAVIALIEPCWLEKTMQISCCQTVTATQIMSIYLQLTLRHKGQSRLTDMYTSLLLSLGIKIPTMHSYSYSQQLEMSPAIYDFATIQLALNRFPRVLLPEILGFTLAYCQMPTLLDICFPQHNLPSLYFKQRQHILGEQLKPLTRCIAEYMDSFPSQQPMLWHRVQQGFWLYQLQMQHCRDHFNQPVKQILTTQHVDDKPSQLHTPLINYAELSRRELYYYLINVDLFPDVLKVASHNVKQWLALSGLFNPLPFKQYSHQQFDAFIDTLYQTEVERYQPLQGTPKISKAAYIWGIEQIAPMILIDGCWLQQSLMLKNVNADICDILFSIYCDEVGNGQLQKNHCTIFQQLLDTLSISVPPVHSAEFSKHSRFIDSAFDLPVYMLALSAHSAKFLPELLGLNMAIELSGLGKDYKRLVDEWNYWGIDSTIADIHISIDNYATGHTLLAKKAIQLYMDDILKCTADVDILNEQWRRIYTGYASLRFVGGRFKRSLPIYYLMAKLKNKRAG